MSWDDWPECGLFDTIALLNAKPEDVIVYYAGGWQHSGRADFAILEDDRHPTLRVDGMTAIAWEDRLGNWHKRPDITCIINITNYASTYYHLEDK